MKKKETDNTDPQWAMQLLRNSDQRSCENPFYFGILRYRKTTAIPKESYFREYTKLLHWSTDYRGILSKKIVTPDDSIRMIEKTKWRDTSSIALSNLEKAKLPEKRNLPEDCTESNKLSSEDSSVMICMHEGKCDNRAM